MTDTVYWIWLASLRGVGVKTKRELLDRFGSPAAVFGATEQELGSCGLTASALAAFGRRNLEYAEKVLQKCESGGVRIITLREAGYPQRLTNIFDPPLVLYVRGALPDIDSEPVVAMVGTRSYSTYGERMARKLGAEVALCGGTVCTGLAGGIDSICAQSALDVGGRVVGVLGTAINQVYPRSNEPLFAAVEQNGALVSEYPPDAQTSARCFPARNRIIAGLSVAVCVVEAPQKSGALITADFAAENGRDVFAVPGGADSDKSRGCNNLLRDGAGLAEAGWDILSAYAARFPEKISKYAQIPARSAESPPPKRAPAENTAAFYKFREPVAKKPKAPEPPPPPPPPDSGLTEAQRKILSAIRPPETHIDDIISASGLTAPQVLSQLTMLQIKGFVRQGAGKRFSRTGKV
ncbi:MAG: DNA-processing protein DprA [Oscillospiraceae bacterium]|nr:DNA-processing protein DprA [Oscillospiraceae bacterium]